MVVEQNMELVTPLVAKVVDQGRLDVIDEGVAAGAVDPSAPRRGELSRAP